MSVESSQEQESTSNCQQDARYSIYLLSCFVITHSTNANPQGVLLFLSKPMIILRMPPPLAGSVTLEKSSYICSSVVKKLRFPAQEGRCLGTKVFFQER